MRPLGMVHRPRTKVWKVLRLVGAVALLWWVGYPEYTALGLIYLGWVTQPER